MFQPPRCPNLECPQHANPSPDFFVKFGSYEVKCRPHPIPRFQCKACEKTFSRQTFRVDYYDKRPHMNRKVVEHLTAGVGFRKSARILNISRKNFVLKWRKLAKHMRGLDLNMKSRAARAQRDSAEAPPLEIQFDELETYEVRRNTRPLSVATMIEARTRLIVGAMAAPIRPKGTMTENRLAAIQAEDELFGPRVDRSHVACRSVFRSTAKLWPTAPVVHLGSDEKMTYPSYFEEAFENRERKHTTTSGKAPRGVGTPLFPINLTEAIMRDHTGRLRRDSWLNSKKRTYLNLHLAFYASWRNWVLPRFNRDEYSPGVLAGMAPRNLTRGEIIGWRQDWGPLSPCPYLNGVGCMADPLACSLTDGLSGV